MIFKRKTEFTLQKSTLVLPTENKTTPLDLISFISCTNHRVWIINKQESQENIAVENVTTHWTLTQVPLGVGRLHPATGLTSRADPYCCQPASKNASCLRPDFYV
jgi:hypothetical protein